MKNKCQYQQPFHPDDIHNKATDHDGQRESPESGSSNGPKFRSIQLILNSEIVEYPGPDTEGKRSDQQGQTTGGKKLVAVNWTVFGMAIVLI